MKYYSEVHAYYVHGQGNRKIIQRKSELLKEYKEQQDHVKHPRNLAWLNLLKA